VGPAIWRLSEHEPWARAASNAEVPPMADEPTTLAALIEEQAEALGD
jgi:hypothetical protein